MTDEFVEIRHMVKSFRVAELQDLLGFANRSKTGRKHQLMGRALEMLKCDPGPKVRTKIRELYGNRFPRRTMYSAPYNLQERPNYTSSIGESSGSVLSAHRPSQSVRLRHLPFFDLKDVLVRPHALDESKNTRYQDMYILFHLTPQQVHEITNSRDNRPMSNSEYNVQIQLRFCLLETTCEQDDLYPHSSSLKVNGKPCQLPGIIPRDNKGEYKKCGRPVDITSYCRLSSTIPNHIHVTWEPDSIQRFAATVHLVKKVTSSCLMQRLKARGIRNSDHSRALIKEKLTQDPDSEVATTSLRCSLLCPLGKTRMTQPCRSKNCNHLQCFDAALYLQMNERKSRWICPVCDQEARFKDLIIDGLFLEILQKYPEHNDIVFFQDGSWDAIGASDSASKMTVINSPLKVKVEKPKLIKEDEKPKAKSHPPVIDLTMSSDEEEGGNDCARTSRIPVLSSMPSAHHPAMPSFLYPIADQSSVLDLGFEPSISSLFPLPTGNLDLYYDHHDRHGLRGQNAAHPIDLD